MLVLVIMFLPTIKVSADTYTAKDNIVFDIKYYEFFKHHFENKSYQFFAYDCTYSNYNRTCYFGIDNDNNYVKISYNSDSYNDISITKGIDNNFKVTGMNVIKVSSSTTYAILNVLIFSFCLILFLYLLGGLL